MAGDGSDWVPAQYPKDQDAPDLRALTAMEPRGYKVAPLRTGAKRRRQEEVEDAPVEMDIAADDAPTEVAPKRQKADEKTYRVSGKVWKAPGIKASTVMKATSLGRKSWDKKMTEKAARKHIQEAKSEAVAAVKAKRKAVADQRKAAKERKVANQAKSAVVQKITNSATVKKMMKDKKQRKLLRTADTN